MSLLNHELLKVLIHHHGNLFPHILSHYQDLLYILLHLIHLLVDALLNKCYAKNNNNISLMVDFSLHNLYSMSQMLYCYNDLS